MSYIEDNERKLEMLVGSYKEDKIINQVEKSIKL